MELYAVITLGITIGILGSVHCVGMCGPIALTIPVAGNNFMSRLLSVFLYNLGRAVTYAAMGALVGLVGKGIMMGGFQRYLSITIGVAMILWVIFPAFFNKLAQKMKFTSYLFNKSRDTFRKLFQQRTYKALFTIGILNGLLPCGLVYVALASSLNTTDVFKGALLMFFFGLGTAPLLFALSMAGKYVTLNFRTFIQKSVPFIIVSLGVLFILRGLNLGIPFISPNESKLTIDNKPAMEQMMQEEKPGDCCVKKNVEE